MNDQLRCGFRYTVKIRDRHGKVRDTETVLNLIPTEGLNHLLDVALKGGTQVTSWFIGLYGGNYTPETTDTAATFPASATESSDYDEETRQDLTLGSIAGGTVGNTASKAEFTASDDVTFYGGFVSSASAKGATSGILLSAVRFASPKVLASGEVLEVTADFTLVSI